MAESPEYYWLDSPPIIVDDSDPTIQYNGEWYAANATDLLRTNFPNRVPMFATFHVLQIFNGSFSYNFTGAGISVFTTPIENTTFTTQCSLDGHPLNIDADAERSQYGESRPVCLVSGLAENTVHTISVSVSVPPPEQPDSNDLLSGFAFDYFLIQPPAGATSWDNHDQDVYLPLLDTAVSIGTSTHPTLNFGLSFTDNNVQIADVSRGWSYDPTSGFQTTTPGSQFNLTFTGTCLWWYGYNNNTPQGNGSGRSFDIDPYSATFTIDGSKPTNFGSAIFPVSQSQAFQFRTPILPYATHQLEVVYYGSNQSLPLTLQSLLIQKNTKADSAQLPGNTSPPTAKRGHIGVIAGGTGGGVALLLLVACGMYVLTRWTRKRRQSKRTGEHSIAATPEPFPVPIAAAAGILVPRKERASQDGIEHPATQQLQPPPLNKWSRLHTGIPASSDHDRIPISPDTKLQDEGPLDPEPPINPLVILDDSQQPPIVRDTTNQQSGPQTADALSPTRPTPMISTSLSGAESEREEEGSEPRMASASDVPPAYTTH